MSTINENVVHLKNRKLVKIINLLGDLLLSENEKLYEDFVNENLINIPNAIEDEQIEYLFLHKLYLNLIIKLSRISYV